MPKSELPKSADGKLNWVRLKRLKISARNWILTFSPTAVFLRMETSSPRSGSMRASEMRGAFPKRKGAGELQAAEFK